MPEIAKTLIIVGLLFVIIGVVIALAGKLPWFGRLPGDIFIKKGNFTFYFPIMTSIILSILLSLFFFLWNRS
jgi:hypothetical protein